MKLIGARLIDGTGAAPIENATLILDERVRDIASDNRLADYPDPDTLDIGGRTVMPGLINAHVHLTHDAGAPDPLKALRDEPPAVTAIRAASRARRMLEAGITTARDVGGVDFIELAVRDLIKRGEIPGPRLLCAGKQITMTGGQGWPMGRESDGPDEVRKAVREQLKAGADLIKLMATGGVLTPGVEPGTAQLTEDELRAGASEARRAGRRTAVHAQGIEGMKAAIRAGIDTIEHGVFLDDEAAAMMKERDLVFVPTLAAAYRITQAGRARGIPQYAMDKMGRINAANTHTFQLAWRAGVIIAAGNDGGTPFNPHEDLMTELRLMAEAGVPPLDAIRAGTWGSARALGLEDELGTIECGKWADLVVLDGDPLVDLTAVSRVWCVLQHGTVVHRATTERGR
ncbi:MAG: amidohydrolase family protein [Candidatus Rokubacteria bacterium]|nr:amidohydrolase family protein [Candidatus Rokubacteria bacterium]